MARRTFWRKTAPAIAAVALFVAPAALGLNVGDPCDRTKNRLTPDSNQFISECGYTAFCGTDNKCQKNGCRRDEYPFGYTSRSDWPPLCAENEFCPDELDACRPKLALGSPCQLNRDDECAPPPADLVAQGVESICLKYTCQYKNVTAGQACINENTVYTVYSSPVVNYGDIVSRDNCQKRFYCNAATALCLDKRNIGEPCAADKECNSYHCEDDTGAQPDELYNTQPNGRCALPPNIPTEASPWIYVVVALAVVIAGVSLCFGLFTFHARGRRKRNAEIRHYYEAQATLRDEILETYEVAKLMINGNHGQQQQQQYQQHNHGESVGYATATNKAPLAKAALAAEESASHPHLPSDTSTLSMQDRRPLQYRASKEAAMSDEFALAK